MNVIKKSNKKKLWQGEKVWPLINEGRGNRMEVKWQTLAKSLASQFLLQLSANNQSQTRLFKMYILPTFTNIIVPFMKSIS